jgi:hypothetical protein
MVLNPKVAPRHYPCPDGTTRTVWLCHWRGAEGEHRSKSFASDQEAQAWGARLVAHPALGAIPPRKRTSLKLQGSIRKRLFARRYGPPAVLWIVNWRDLSGIRHERGFPTRREGEAWLMQIAADPGLGTGKRLQNAIKAARRDRWPPRRMTEDGSDTVALEPANAEPPNPLEPGTALDDVVAVIRQEMSAHPLVRLADAIADLRELHRRNVTALERLAGIVEQPAAPRTSRRNPMGG